MLISIERSPRHDSQLASVGFTFCGSMFVKKNDMVYGIEVKLTIYIKVALHQIK